MEFQDIRDVFLAIQDGQMTFDEFEYWCSELRTRAVEDAEYAAASYRY